MSSNTRQQLENYLKKIDVKADKVLDIGGSQLPIKGRTKSWEVKDYKILDLDKPHECKKEPDIVCDVNQSIVSNMAVQHISADDKNKFDLVFCIEVSEYWYNPLTALKNIWYMLKMGGELYISFHTVYPEHKPEGTDYLRYTKAGIARLLKEADFMLNELTPRKARTVGNIKLKTWYQFEGMRGWDHINTDEIGYIAKATKIKPND